MPYYSIDTLADAYSLSAEAIKYRIKKGILKAIKLSMSEQSPHYFKFVVPESELPKIEKFKLSEPQILEVNQPEYWTEYFRKQRAEREKCNKINEQARIRYEKYRMYDEYMHSEDWLQKRMQRLQMDNFQCQICGTAKNLRVHHITYAHIRNEPMEDLVTLCDECHRKVHENDINTQGHPVNIFGEIEEFFAEE